MYLSPYSVKYVFRERVLKVIAGAVIKFSKTGSRGFP